TTFNPFLAYADAHNEMYGLAHDEPAPLSVSDAPDNGFTGFGKCGRSTLNFVLHCSSAVGAFAAPCAPVAPSDAAASSATPPHAVITLRFMFPPGETVSTV